MIFLANLKNGRDKLDIETYNLIYLYGSYLMHYLVAADLAELSIEE